MQRFNLLCLSLMLCVSQAMYAESANPISQTTLSNGMKVYVLENHRAPIATFQIWYRVGASDEPNGLTGISHVLEHMMFKGTQKNPGSTFSEKVTLAGGEQNAGTSADYTVYYQTMAADRIALSFELEADRLSNLVLKPEDFEKEIKVVKEERRMRTENNPQALTMERLNATAFVASPYHHPVVGWMRDLEQMTLADVVKWYQQWYKPNNAFILITGDVQPDAMFKLAETHFGSIPAGNPITRKQFSSEDNIGLRRLSVSLPAQLPWLAMGYLAPALTAADQKDIYALIVLSNILDGGESARFETSLVRDKKLASSIGLAYSPLNRYDDLLLMYATPTQGTSLEALEAAIFAEIEAIKTTPVSADELKRVKTQTVAGDVFMRDSLYSQTQRLGLIVNLNLPLSLIDTYVKAIEAVTAEDIQAAAQKYLTRDRLTIATLTPEHKD